MCSQASNTQSDIIFIRKVKQRFWTRSPHWFAICYIIIHMSLDWIGICHIIIHMCSQASNVQSNIVLFTKWSNAFNHEVSVDFRFGNSRAKPRFKHAVQVKFFINKVRHPFEHEASIYFLFGSRNSHEKPSFENDCGRVVRVLRGELSDIRSNAVCKRVSSMKGYFDQRSFWSIIVDSIEDKSQFARKLYWTCCLSNLLKDIYLDSLTNSVASNWLANIC